MSKEVTIESVLRDYYHSIPSENLSEDKITIDEDLAMESSKELHIYVIRLAIFLNECYYKGYVLSGSILKRLMDIIDYEGYQCQILYSYMDILNKAMVDHNISENVKPDFDNLNPDIDTCREYITTYAEVISNSSRSVFRNDIIPHFKKSDDKEDLRMLYTLQEVENPINFISSTIDDKLIPILHVLYKTDKERFLDLINIKE